MSPPPLSVEPQSSAGAGGGEAGAWHRQWNIANQITLSRLVLTLACLALIDARQWGWAALVFFVAASTDFVDGYIARKYGLVTVLGRVLDPLVDKMLVGGAFVFLGAVPEARVSPWVAVIVIGRELFITSLRGLLEAAGKDFSAAWSGKVKMVLQCAAVVAVLLELATAPPADWPQAYPIFHWLKVGLIWGAVISTLTSAWVYLERAARLLRPQGDH